MPTARLVRFPSHHHNLAAAGGKRGDARLRTQQRDGAVAQQHEVDQGDEQLFKPGACFLIRKAADQVSSAGFQLCQQARQGSRGKPNVGVQKAENLMAGEAGKCRAGMLLPIPAGRQQRSAAHGNTGIPHGDRRDQLGGPVSGCVVEHDDFKVQTVRKRADRSENAFDCGNDACFFIACRDQDGNAVRRKHALALSRLAVVNHVDTESSQRAKRAAKSQDETDRHHLHSPLVLLRHHCFPALHAGCHAPDRSVRRVPGRAPAATHRKCRLYRPRPPAPA